MQLHETEKQTVLLATRKQTFLISFFCCMKATVITSTEWEELYILRNFVFNQTTLKGFYSNFQCHLVFSRTFFMEGINKLAFQLFFSYLLFEVAQVKSAEWRQAFCFLRNDNYYKVCSVVQHGTSNTKSRCGQCFSFNSFFWRNCTEKYSLYKKKIEASCCVTTAKVCSCFTKEQHYEIYVIENTV